MTAYKHHDRLFRWLIIRERYNFPAPLEKILLACAIVEERQAAEESSHTAKILEDRFRGICAHEKRNVMLEGSCRYEIWMAELRRELVTRGLIAFPVTEEMSLVDLYANDYTPHEAAALLLEDYQEGCPADG